MVDAGSRLGWCLLTAVAMLAAAPSSGNAAGGAATIAGRIVVRDASHEARADEVERSRWGHLVIELRRGWEVFSARPDANGVFSVEGPPGKYRLEYVRIGDLAEFVVPHDIEARRGVVNCMGTLEIVVGDLVKDLGNNAGSQLRVRDDCAAIGPELPARGEVVTSLAHPAARERQQASFVELATGLRIAMGLSDPTDHVATWRGIFALDLTEDHGWGNWMASAAIARLSPGFIDARWSSATSGAPGAGAGWAGEVGAGYTVYGLELQAFGGYMSASGSAPHGPSGGLGLRFGNFLLGFFGRYDWYPSTGDRVGTVGLELSPFGLLGVLL